MYLKRFMGWHWLGSHIWGILLYSTIHNWIIHLKLIISKYFLKYAITSDFTMSNFPCLGPNFFHLLWSLLKIQISHLLFHDQFFITFYSEQIIKCYEGVFSYKEYFFLKCGHKKTNKLICKTIQWEYKACVFFSKVCEEDPSL